MTGVPYMIFKNTAFIIKIKICFWVRWKSLNNIRTISGISGQIKKALSKKEAKDLSGLNEDISWVRISLLLHDILPTKNSIQSKIFGASVDSSYDRMATP